MANIVQIVQNLQRQKECQGEYRCGEKVYDTDGVTNYFQVVHAPIGGHDTGFVCVQLVRVRIRVGVQLEVVISSRHEGYEESEEEREGGEGDTDEEVEPKVREGLWGFGDEGYDSDQVEGEGEGDGDPERYALPALVRQEEDQTGQRQQDGIGQNQVPDVVRSHAFQSQREHQVGKAAKVNLPHFAVTWRLWITIRKLFKTTFYSVHKKFVP